MVFEQDRRNHGVSLDMDERLRATGRSIVLRRATLRWLEYAFVAWTVSLLVLILGAWQTWNLITLVVVLIRRWCCSPSTMAASSRSAAVAYTAATALPEPQSRTQYGCVPARRSYNARSGGCRRHCATALAVVWLD